MSVQCAEGTQYRLAGSTLRGQHHTKQKTVCADPDRARTGANHHLRDEGQTLSREGGIEPETAEPENETRTVLESRKHCRQRSCTKHRSPLAVPQAICIACGVANGKGRLRPQHPTAVTARYVPQQRKPAQSRHGTTRRQQSNYSRCLPFIIGNGNACHPHEVANTGKGTTQASPEIFCPNGLAHQRRASAIKTEATDDKGHQGAGTSVLSIVCRHLRPRPSSPRY